MRCSKAKEYYFKNIDNLLNEAEKMKLQEHLAGCTACAVFKGEMDESLELLNELPEPKVSENFEWNVKRRIAQERSNILRERNGIYVSKEWGFKFFAGAAAMVVIVLSGAWYFFGVGQQGPGAPLEIASRYENSSAEVTHVRDSGSIRFTNTGYPAGFKMVSDDPYEYGAGNNYSGQLSSRVLEQSRLYYLKKENLLLRNSVINLKRENVMLRKIIIDYTKNEN